MTESSKWISALSGEYRFLFSVFEQTLRECPAELWTTCMWDVTKDPERPADPLLPDGQPDPRGVQLHSQFWYVASHVLLTLDFNFALRAPSWEPPPPFTGEKMGTFLLSRVYERDELMSCLGRQRDNAAALMAAVDEGATLPEGLKGFDPIANGLVGNLRHAYVHWGQLAMFLWQHRD